MKKSLSAFILFTSAYTHAGTAFIPNFIHHPSGTWCVTISNISATLVSVTVKAFKADGTKYTGPSVGNSIPSDFNTPFNLAPNQTTLLCSQNASGTAGHGYGTITATPQTDNDVGNGFVIAHAYYHPTSPITYTRSIPVNSGMPF